MFEQLSNIEILRLIGAFIASACLGWVLYVSAYVKHKNEKIEASMYKAWATDGMSTIEKVGVAKTETWYVGYKLALIVLVAIATVIGWVVSWAVGQETILSDIEDVAVAIVGSVIGGLVADRYIIHPIADGSFFEKVEVPITENFLKNGNAVLPEKVKEKKIKTSKLAHKSAPAPAPATEKGNAESVTDAPLQELTLQDLTFEEKCELIEKLRKSL